MSCFTRTQSEGGRGPAALTSIKLPDAVLRAVRVRFCHQRTLAIPQPRRPAYTTALLVSILLQKDLYSLYAIGRSQASSYQPAPGGDMELSSSTSTNTPKWSRAHGGGSL